MVYTEQMQTLELRGHSAGTSVRVNEKLIVRLRESPGTGYRWQCDLDEAQNLKLMTWDTHPEPGQPRTIGGRIIRDFEFKTTHPGASLLVFNYVRPWEAFSKPIEQRLAIINIMQEATDAA